MAIASTQEPPVDSLGLTGEFAAIDRHSVTQGPITRIEPPQGRLQLPNFVDVWRYRDLLTLLIWRDLSARYRQSIVGYGWAFIRPTVSVLIFALIFGGLAGLPSDGVPYPLFTLAALIPWTYFSNSLLGISFSIVGSIGLFTKVYFPRLVLPLASLGTGLAELGLQLILMAGLLLWYGITPGWPILLLPFFVLLTIVSAFAFGLWLSALNVRYRDVGHAVPFLLQIWMWLSPVVYSSQLVPHRWGWAYSLNPMVGAIDGFRWTIAGTPPPDLTGLVISTAVVAVTLLSGLMFFQQQEPAFADVV